MATPAPTTEDPSTSTTIPQSILDKLDPEYRTLVLTRPPLSRLPIHNLTWSSYFRESAKSNPPELGEEPGIPVGSTKTVELDGFTATMLTPDGEPPKSGWPVLIWIHGGGWVFGSAESGVSTYSRACVGTYPTSIFLNICPESCVIFVTHRSAVCGTISGV